jgi:glutaredoxin 3
MSKVELFGSAGCEHTESMRAWLEFRGVEFVEYDVEADRSARDRLKALVHGQRMVPVLVEDGVVSEIGWQGRGCVMASGE